jgi:hypothetical protein
MASNPFKVGDLAQVCGATSFKPQRVKKVDRVWISFDGALWAHYSGYLKVGRSCKPDAEMVITTPFPDPDRWQAKDQYVYVSANRDFAAQHEYAAAKITDSHNAEIDRLMGEIRRLEALVQK